MTVNYIEKIFSNIFSLNFWLDIVRNIFTIIIIGLALYIFNDIYPINSDYLLLFLLVLIGITTYFSFPFLSKIYQLMGKEFFNSFNFPIHTASIVNSNLMKISTNEQKVHNYFVDLPDKKKAWDDLICLTRNKDMMLRASATNSLASIFPYVPDKKIAWKDLVLLMCSDDNIVRKGVAESLGDFFKYHSNKSQAWDDLYLIIQNEKDEIQLDAIKGLGNAFSYIPDKNKAWDELIRLTQEENSDLHQLIAYLLVTSFSVVSDKEKAWEDLKEKIQNENENKNIQSYAIDSNTFAFDPEKIKVNKDLIEKIYKNKNLQSYAIGANPSIFEADRNKTWDELIRLKQKENSDFCKTNESIPFYLILSYCSSKSLNENKNINEYSKDSFVPSFPERTMKLRDIVKLIEYLPNEDITELEKLLRKKT